MLDVTLKCNEKSSTVESRFNEVPRDWEICSLYRTSLFNEFSGKLPKCSLYRGKVNNQLTKTSISGSEK